MVYYTNSSKQIIIFALIFVFSLLIDLVARIMIMLAVNEDAKAIGVKNRTLWDVLTFFIPICALIYLGLRNSLQKTVPRLCMQCGETMPPNVKVCLNCSSTALLDYTVANADKYKKSRKTYLILGIVFLAVSFVTTQVALAGIGSEVYKRYGESGEKSYSDYFDEFGRYFEQYGRPEYDNGNSERDSNDFFDDFNNFGANEEESTTEEEKDEKEKSKDKKDKEKKNDKSDEDMYDYFNEFGE